VIHPGQRHTLPWGHLGGPLEALQWWRAASPLKARALTLRSRIHCREALAARCEVARGSCGQTTIATALYGWPDADDFHRVGELEDDELQTLRDEYSAQLGAMEEALTWLTTT
jgi:hypothetical protein